MPDNALAEGTPIHPRLDREISSRDNGAGTVFTAQVDQDVVQNGRVIIPTGSVIHGRVTHADYGRRISGHGSLRLLADEVVLPDGTRKSVFIHSSDVADRLTLRENDRIEFEVEETARGGKAVRAVLLSENAGGAQ